MHNFSNHRPSWQASYPSLNLANSTMKSFLQRSCEQPITLQAKTIGPKDDCIYVSGYVKAEFSNIGLEKEFERCLLSGDNKGGKNQYLPKDYGQALIALKMNGKDLQQYLFEVLSQPANAYLAREMKWSLVNSYGNDIYDLQVSQRQLKQLVLATRPRKQGEADSANESNDYKKSAPVMVVGRVAGNSTDGLPILTISKIDALNPTSIIDSVSEKVRDINVDKLKRLMVEILSLAENDGATDKDRALNYTLLNNQAMYNRSYNIIYESSNAGSTSARLSAVQVLPEISGDRLVAKVIFDYQSSNGGASQSWHSVVDIDGEYPFLLVDFKPYIPSY